MIQFQKFIFNSFIVSLHISKFIYSFVKIRMSINFPISLLLASLFYFGCCLQIELQARENPTHIEVIEDVSNAIHQFDENSQLRDDKNNITDAELNKLKGLIKNAENTYLPTQLTKIAKFIYDGMLGPSYERWNVFIFTPKMNDIFMNSYKVLENKYIWISDKNVTKLNYTYALFQQWICSSPVPGGFSPANFSENMNDTMKQKIVEIVNNSIIYRGEDMKSASDYIQGKINQFSECRWNVIISSSNSTLGNNNFGYYRCDCYDKWANFRGYGDFKWNYYIYAG